MNADMLRLGWELFEDTTSISSKDGTVARIDRNVREGRLRFWAQAQSVVETVAGQADAFISAGLGDHRTARGSEKGDTSD